MRRAARLPTCTLIALAASIAGCDATPIEDDLSVASDGAVSVDAQCAEPCITDALATLEVSYADRDQPRDEVLVLTEYRVTYRLAQLELPAFEGELSKQLAPGDTQTLSLPMAGAEQRAAVLEADGGREAFDGSALVELAGHDRNGEDVSLEVELAIEFLRGGQGGTAVDTVSLALAVPASVMHPLRIYRRGTDDEPCVADLESEDVGDRDIECMLEIDELDLFVLGVSFDTIASKGACDFVQHGAPMFAAFPVGEGPTTVAYTRYEDGSVTNEVNAEAGEPKCPFDYSPTGPNCCYGDYTLEVTSATNDVMTVSHGSWGTFNDLAPCYEGAAFHGTDLPISANGFPADRIVYIGGDAYSETRAFAGLSGTHPRISYPLANYYDPEDHGGQAPAPFRDAAAREQYEFFCLDDAEEMIGRIRLTVREWNEEQEFDRRGDPDSQGEERDWGTPLNDVADWRDIAPDADSYPLIARPKAM